MRRVGRYNLRDGLAAAQRQDQPTLRTHPTHRPREDTEAASCYAADTNANIRVTSPEGAERAENPRNSTIISSRAHARALAGCLIDGALCRGGRHQALPPAVARLVALASFNIRRNGCRRHRHRGTARRARAGRPGGTALGQPQAQVEADARQAPWFGGAATGVVRRDGTAAPWRGLRDGGERLVGGRVRGPGAA